MDLEQYQEKVDAIVDHYEVVRIDKGTKRVHLRDLRWGVEFTYQHASWLSKLRKKPQGVFWSATRGNVTSVPEGDCPFRIEAEQRLAAIGNTSFEVVSYDPASKKAVIRDSVSGASKEYKFKPFLANLKRGTVSGPTKTLKAKSQAAIDAASPGRFTVLSAEPSEGGTRVVIEDRGTNVLFSHHLKYIVYRLKKNPAQVFGRSQAEITEARKATNQERFGVDFPLQTEEKKQKARRTLIENHGVDNYAKTPEYREKFKKTHLKRYGVEHQMKAEVFKEKLKETSRSNHEGVYHTKHPSVQKRVEKTNQERYGAKTPLVAPRIRKRIVEKWKQVYGVDNPQKIPEVVAKRQATKAKLGYFELYDGKTIPQIAKEIGSGVGYVRRLIKRVGYEKAKPLLDSYEPGGSTLTRYVVSWFDDSHLIVDRQLPETSYRPDLRFEDQKVIVEADGLYWHSDGSKNETWNPGRTYHLRKLTAYESLGYRALFFRSDELYEKPEIVKSIVLNALRENKNRVFARKCTIQEIDPDFFTKTHLMGRGSGRCYGLVHNGKVVAGIQVRWVRKSTRLLDVSRFSTASSTSVPGGWSRLIKHVLKTEKPNTIQTFIDRRYGQGTHLASQGWVRKTEEPSFRWTDGILSLHRMTYPGNSGYEHGFFKIWDCGQAKWLLSTGHGFGEKAIEDGS